MSKIALVTGATSGIGRATAIDLAKEGYHLIISGRRAERLKELSSTVEVPTLELVFDVREKETVFKAIDSIPEDWKAIDVLVNNAGNAHGLSTFQEGDLADWDAMIDINVKWLL